MTKYRNAVFKNEHPQQLRSIENRETKKAKSQKPDKQEPSTQIVQGKEALKALELKNHQKRMEQLPFKRVFLVMSKMHGTLKLRFQTLFLAIQIYLKFHETKMNPQVDAKQQEQIIPEDCLIVVCMFLAMKYEEIYPPMLKSLFICAKVTIPLDIYMRYQTQVLIKIEGNLNLKTLKNKMDGLLKDCSLEVSFQAYYFLQIACLFEDIIETFSLDIICKSIRCLMTPINTLKQGLSSKNSEHFQIERCSKILIFARCQDTANKSCIFSKYNSEKYMRVAERSWLSLLAQQ